MMEFETYSHRYGMIIANEPDFLEEWEELVAVIRGISDEDIKRHHEARGTGMSLSVTINDLMAKRLEGKGWLPEAAIFQDPAYSEKKDTRWRLDFSKANISLEVAFNHGEAIAWNLLKPVLASELNHVRKARQTKMGVVIAATEDLKKVGAFDTSVGSYEKIIKYLMPLNNILTVPMIIIGLKVPKTFIVEKVKGDRGKHRGVIRTIENRPGQQG